jgi:hypothetical protein
MTGRVELELGWEIHVLQRVHLRDFFRITILLHFEKFDIVGRQLEKSEFCMLQSIDSAVVSEKMTFVNIILIRNDCKYKHETKLD